MSQPVLADLNFDEDQAHDLVDEIETSFGIELTDADIAPIETMGALHALLVQKLVVTDQPTGKHAPQMAFYRIRRALEDRWPRQMLRPDTDLKLLAGKRPDQFLKRLAGQSGLNIPQARLGWSATIAFIVAFFSGFVLLGFFNVYLLTLFGVCVALFVFMPRQIDARLETLGDLATAAGLRSLKQLAQDGARVDSRTIWQALVEATADEAGEGTVGPETRFYRERKPVKA